MCLIEATQIKVCFAEKTILADLNLKIPAGKITAIIGPNGSGKSTLLKALTGLVKVKQGQVLFKNNPLQKISSKKLAQQMAFLPQSPLVPADLTVKDLKKLIFNSIEFSSLNSSEKQKAKLHLQKEWTVFVKNNVE